MSPIAVSYAALGCAILLETIGTALLAQSQQFTKPWPSVGTTVCYVLSFYLLSHALKTMPVGIAYAIWSGLGIVLISTVGYIAFRQTLDLAAIIGIGFILTGVVIVNAFSTSATH
ncbi:DMT family transporter [Rhodopseudomonas pseudopalustris]|nr:SMR family transporter [Rhodopseudomonas pseudopalustris]